MKKQHQRRQRGRQCIQGIVATIFTLIGIFLPTLQTHANQYQDMYQNTLYPRIIQVAEDRNMEIQELETFIADSIGRIIQERGDSLSPQSKNMLVGIQQAAYDSANITASLMNDNITSDTSIEELYQLELNEIFGSTQALTQLSEEQIKEQIRTSIDEQIEMGTLNMNYYGLLAEFDKEIYEIDVSFSPVKNIIINAGKVNNLNNLSYIGLDNTKIIQIPLKLSMLPNLAEIGLSDTNINTIPNDIGQLKNLKRLILNDTNIENLPPEISQLKKLERLDVSKTEIISLPPEIGQLSNLQQLNLGQTNIINLPPEIGQLKNLKILTLHDTKLKSLPPEIGQLHNLEILQLTWMDNLLEIPGTATNLQNLKELRISKKMNIELPAERLEREVNGTLTITRY